nr:ribonuclease III [Thiococcus pfennigii]
MARRLGHRFRDEDLVVQALTHRSASSRNNERLEFLGDALLGLIIAEVLWQRFPDASEGDLSRLRASLVNKEMLAHLARGLALGDYLVLGPGELRTGGHGRDSILADALEAVFAAVYLDAGFDAVRRVILGIFEEALAETRDDQVDKDPKTRLQERLQADKRPLPEYEVLGIDGSQHAQVFRVRCRLPDDGSEVRGDGTSRRRAEQAAAESMLRSLDDAD